MTGYAKAGTDLDALLEPWQAGDGYAAATGYKINGADLNTKYAPASVGSAYTGGTGYKQGGTDIGPRFAAKGSRQTALPIDGQSYTSSVNILSGQTGSASIGVRIINGSSWQVYKLSSASSLSVLASGSVPASAASVKFTWGAYSVPVGYTDAGGGTSNDAPSAVAVSSNPDARYTTSTVGATSGSRERSYPFTLDFYNGSGSNVSHSQCTLIGDTEGSI